MSAALLRRVVRFAAAACAGLLWVAAPGSYADAQTRALTGPQVGDPAPAFALTTLDGTAVTLRSFAGKTLVVNVWATWCPPCRSETPDLVISYARLHRADVAFLGVDSTEEAPIVRAFVAAKGIPYPQAIDSAKRFERAYDIRYFPTTLIIDPRGILRARYIDVISPSVLARLAAAAAHGHDGVLTSALQRRIDASLRVPLPARSASIKVRFAAADGVRRAIEKAEDLLNDSDPATGETVDLLETRAEEAGIRDRAIALLGRPLATDRRSNALLARLLGDAALDRESWRDALPPYHRVLALDPSNIEVLQGVALAASRLEEFDMAIAADARLVALQPDDVSALVSLGLIEAKAQHVASAYQTFDRAIALAQHQVRAHPHDTERLRLLAWAHLYAGRTYAKGGDRASARREFAAVSRVALELPHNDERHDMYLEEAQEAVVALDLQGTRAQTSLALSPWTGADLPGSVPNTIKYRLIVTGAAGATVALDTKDVPPRWVASFCTDRLCAPFHVVVLLPPSGVKMIEFQLVPDGPHHSTPHVLIEASDRQARGSAQTGT
jgi:peroxiredoxin/regulator of sirC expression with transglutaminase-like and TPR domain